MKNLLILLLCLLSTLGQAQTNLPPPFAPFPLDYYAGSPANLNGGLIIVGSPAQVSAPARLSRGGELLAPADQPSLVVQGGNFYIAWSGAQTARINKRTEQIYLELIVGGTVVRAQPVFFRFATRPLLPADFTISINVSTVTRADINAIRDSLRVSVAGSSSTATGQAIIATTQAGIALQAAIDASNAKTLANGSKLAAAVSETNAASSAGAAQTYASQANGSKLAAAVSETNAAGSASGAQTARTGAETAKTGAETARDASINAATSSGQSAQQALDYRNLAQTYSTSAAASATSAATSATNAAGSATAANGSKTSAATSETNAAASAAQALGSKNSAAVSETNAAGSATAANNSKVAAAQSETNAAGYATNAQNSANTATSQAQNYVVQNTNVAISYTIDCSVRDNVSHYLTLTGNTTLSITNMAAGKNIHLRVVQGGAGGFTITFPGSVTFPGGAAIDWATTPTTGVNVFDINAYSTTAADGWYSKK